MVVAGRGMRSRTPVSNNGYLNFLAGKIGSQRAITLTRPGPKLPQKNTGCYIQISFELSYHLNELMILT